LQTQASAHAANQRASPATELQQTAGINYYMREIFHVIALFDQK
jgi:hypothetical protein